METKSEKIVLGGGCFWCTEAIFQRLKGVISVESGYSGGKIENPTSEQVYSGKTGHAEVIQITFDPTIISLGKILDVFWHLHNPTTLNQQGYDMGTEYRSIIFYMNDEQKRIAEKSKKDLENSGYYKDKIVTEIVPFTNFYKAEEHHQNYYNNNNYGDGYCQVIIDPKIKKLLTSYFEDIKEEYKRQS